MSESRSTLSWRGQDPLAWLLAPTPVGEFLSRSWEREALVQSRADCSYYEDLLTFEDVNEFMSRNDIRYPYLRLVKNGRELPLVDYADDFVYGNNIYPGLLDNDRVFAHFSEGATLSFQLFQKCMPKLSEFCNALEARLRFQTQVNIFVTPPWSKGFTAHYDDHSFFIFQVSGRKHWKVYDNPVELPLQEFRAKAVTPELGQAREITLTSGDLLYLPKGYYHEASTSDESSVHITLGIFPYSWLQLLQVLVERAKEDVEFRRAPTDYLLPDTSQSALQEGFDQLLRKLSAQAVLPLLETLSRTAASKQVVDSRNRLRDLTAIGELTEDTWLVKRSLLWTLQDDPRGVRLALYDKALFFPSSIECSLREILGLDRFQVGSTALKLDKVSRINLMRKLIKEGLLSFDDSLARNASDGDQLKGPLAIRPSVKTPCEPDM